MAVTPAGHSYLRVAKSETSSERAIQGKVIVITGATSGIGQIAAERLARMGARSAENYQASIAYGTSKLCNILFTRELARRVASQAIAANSFSPGFVATRFGDAAGGIQSFALRVGKPFAKTPEEGVRTTGLSCIVAGCHNGEREFFTSANRG